MPPCCSYPKRVCARHSRQSHSHSQKKWYYRILSPSWRGMRSSASRMRIPVKWGDWLCRLVRNVRWYSFSSLWGAWCWHTENTFFGPHYISFGPETFTRPYYNSFGDGYPSFGPAHPPAGPPPSLLLDLALSQTIPFSDRFYSFRPAGSASQFFRQ